MRAGRGQGSRLIDVSVHVYHSLHLLIQHEGCAKTICKGLSEISFNGRHVDGDAINLSSSIEVLRLSFLVTNTCS